MKATSKVYKKALHILEKIFLWIIGILGGGVLFFYQDHINSKLIKLYGSPRLILMIEWCLLLVCLFASYLLLFRSKSKKEMTELKVFLNNNVYSRYRISNPFLDGNIFPSIEDHLSWKPFYDVSEKPKSSS